MAVCLKNVQVVIVLRKTWSNIFGIKKKIFLIFSITLGGLLGWKLGDSFGIMITYLMSFSGSLVGVILGVIINQRYLDWVAKESVESPLDFIPVDMLDLRSNQLEKTNEEEAIFWRTDHTNHWKKEKCPSQKLIRDPNIVISYPVCSDWMW